MRSHLLSWWSSTPYALTSTFIRSHLSKGASVIIIFHTLFHELSSALASIFGIPFNRLSCSYINALLISSALHLTLTRFHQLPHAFSFFVDLRAFSGPYALSKTYFNVLNFKHFHLNSDAPISHIMHYQRLQCSLFLPHTLF